MSGWEGGKPVTSVPGNPAAALLAGADIEPPGDQMQNAQYASRRSFLWPLLLLAVLTLVGPYLVKWSPYFNKAFLAAAHHSLGPSIVNGSGAHAPAPSWQSA